MVINNTFIKTDIFAHKSNWLTENQTQKAFTFHKILSKLNFGNLKKNHITFDLMHWYNVAFNDYR